jgi:hypothetical protein
MKLKIGASKKTTKLLVETGSLTIGFKPSAMGCINQQIQPHSGPFALTGSHNFSFTLM